MKITNQSGADDFDKTENNSRETVTIINCVLNAPLMLICIVGNTLVLAAILNTPSLRSPSAILLCSLAVSDFLVGLIVQPVYIASELTVNHLYLARNTTVLTAVGVSLFTITAIAVDKYFALHYHMRYPNLMTTSRAVYISTTIWLFCIVLSLVCLWYTFIFFISMGIFIAICLVISAACYIAIYRVVRQHQLQITAQQQVVQCFTENNQSMRVSKKNAISTFIYFLVMILCYFPSFIAFLILIYYRGYWTEKWKFAFTISFMNSSINPLLYCWRQCEIRSAVIKTAKQMLCKQTQET